MIMLETEMKDTISIHSPKDSASITLTIPGTRRKASPEKRPA